MKIQTLCCALIALLALSVSTLGQEPARPFPRGGTLPATCVLNDVFQKTGASAGFYICTAEPSTWTNVAGGGSGSLSGTAGKLVKFTGPTSGGDSALSESGSTLSVAGQIIATQVDTAAAIADFKTSGGATRLAVTKDGAAQLTPLAVANPTAGTDIALLYYDNSGGTFTDRLLLSINGNAGAPIIRLGSAGTSTANYVPLFSALGELTNSIIQQPSGSLVSVAGNIQATGANYFEGVSTAGAVRFRSINSSGAPGSPYSNSQGVVEALAGLTAGLAYNTAEAAAPHTFFVAATEKFRVTSTGITVTHGTANNSGIRLANLTNASPNGAETKYLALNSSGDIVIGAAIGGATFTVQDEGVSQSTAINILNCVGAGISCSASGATATLTVSGGGGGGSLPAATAQSANYTGLSTDWLISVDATGGNRTITYPTAASSNLKILETCKKDTSANTVIVAATNNYTIYSPNACVRLVSDGVNWNLHQ